MNSSFDIANLIIRSFQNELNDSEKIRLSEWIRADEENRTLYDKLSDDQQLIDRVNLYQQFDSSHSWEVISGQLVSERSFSFFSNRTLKYAASILIPLFISVGLIYFFTQPAADPLANIDEKILPGVQKATLTLADGGQVELEGNAAPGVVQQGDATIKNEGNRLVYSSEKSALQKSEIAFNELTTPYGGRYEVNLSDGTRVILNAGSSLRYPVSFDDSARTVYLVGEAYFDVSHDGSTFIVRHAKQDIRVLGTQFNVSAYENESMVTTTLVKGKVQVESNREQLILEPGEQSILNKEDDGLRMEQVNTSQYTSWINGKFEFNKDNMDIVIKRLSRWYDFDYEFENKEAMNYHFTGRVDQDQPISSILQMLEATSDIHFELNENTIVIN